MGFDHPVAWCKDYQGGRSFYTASAAAAAFSDAAYRAHIAGRDRVGRGRRGPGVLGLRRDRPGQLPADQVSAPPNLSEPIGFDVLPDGRVIQTDRRGGVRLHDPEANHDHVIAEIPVYTNSEDGMYGPAVDNDFAENQLGLPLLRTADHEDDPGDGRLSGHDPDVNGTEHGRRPGAGTRGRLLPAEPLQVRRRDGRTPPTSISPPNRRSSGSRTTAAPAATWPATSTSTREQPVDGDRRRHPGRRRQLRRLRAVQRHDHRDRAVQRAACRRSPVRPEHQRPARQDPADHGPGDGPTRSRTATCSPATRRWRQDAARDLRDGLPNPFRITVDENDVAYITDYSPDPRPRPTSVVLPAPDG